MPFRFLKYLQPTHYFRLKRINGSTVFPKVDDLPQSIINQLDMDPEYVSEQAKIYDLSWQAIHKGYIGEAETYHIFDQLPVIDEYRFLRKNFHSFWVVYVLLLRLLSFENPFKDIPAFFKTIRVNRSLLLKKALPYSKYNIFQSSVIVEKPFVSIIIPTLNRYTYLKDVLLDLENQTYPHFEVIIIDQSEPYDSKFYNDFNLDINLIRQEEKALWLARNTAIKESKGDLILLFDDDSRVNSDWVYEHLKTLDFFNCDLSSGVSISQVGAKVPDDYSFFKLSGQLDTGNVLLKKSVFKTIGLFDRQFEKQRMGDGEFGLRAHLAGFLNVSNHKAKRLHLKVGSGGLREMGSWDAFRTKNIFAPRPIPSVLYFYRRYYGTKRCIYALLRTIPLSLIPYKYKSNQKLLLVGYLLIVLLFPLVLFQMIKSWRISSNKIKEGALINEI